MAEQIMNAAARLDKELYEMMTIVNLTISRSACNMHALAGWLAGLDPNRSIESLSLSFVGGIRINPVQKKVGGP